jgi:DNA sulfur modification protein DndB
VELQNVFASTELRGTSRLLSLPYDVETVPNAMVKAREDAGWNVVRRGKRQSRVSMLKDLKDAFPDRVWTVLYRMGFTHMSGRGGAKLICRSANGETRNQLDVVAIDDDVAIYIECRTSRSPHKVPRFAEDVAHIDGLRSCFQRAVKAKFTNRKVGALYWSQNLILSTSDAERASQKTVRIFNEPELSYYEELTKQLGIAARFQFLADVFGSTRIESLSLKVPAVGIRLGPTRCFSFALTPERLLKIAYVSHRAKGSATDVNTYQRLLRRSRIKDIKDYISNRGGYFPTNIVLNITSRRPLQFDKAAIPANVDSSIGEIGWLTLPAEYKAAWVIDGQHRLFAYANTSEAKRAELSILAFENLKESEQARLFVDINAKQKSVKQNLLVELWAELHWDSSDPEDRVIAIIAKMVLSLDSDPLSPFHNRIVRADDATTPTRSVSLQALTTALQQPEFFMAQTKAGPVPGAFWTTDQINTVKRAADVVNAWISGVIALAQENWQLGRSPGGALGMNDSVVALIMTLRSVLRYFTDRGIKLYELDLAELVSLISPYADELSRAFGSFTQQDFEFFRSLRGNQGQTQRMRELQLVLHKRLPEFYPEGLGDYIGSRDKTAMTEARELLDKIELALHKHVLGTLKATFGEDDAGWWYQGVPKSIRSRIVQEINDEGRDSPKESRFTLIDYRTIAQDKWPLFKDTFMPEKANVSKENRAAWIVRINEIRKFAAHPTKGTAKLEDVQYLRGQWQWLQGQLSATRIPGSSTETEPDSSPEEPVEL